MGKEKSKQVLHRMKIKNTNDHLERCPYVHEMIGIYNLDDAFTIDICELENNTFKIVECNCINSAGFYDIDLTKLIIKLEYFYLDKL